MIDSSKAWLVVHLTFSGGVELDTNPLYREAGLFGTVENFWRDLLKC